MSRLGEIELLFMFYVMPFESAFMYGSSAMCVFEFYENRERE